MVIGSCRIDRCPAVHITKNKERIIKIMTWSKDLIENITDIGELEAKLRFDRRLT